MDGPGLASTVASLRFHLPQWDAQVWLQCMIMVVALIICAIASAAETALTSISRITLKNLIEERDKQAVSIEHLLAKPNTFLATILVFNSVAVIVASSIATVLALRFSATWGELLSSVLLSLFVLIFCEIIPKTAAVQNPLRWSRLLVNVVHGAVWLLRPVVWFLSAITSVFVPMMGGQIKHRGSFVTEEELRLLVTVSEEEGVLQEQETEMIHSIFEFADTTVREVMIPRIDMVILSSEATVIEAVDLAMQGGYSRIPVYEESAGTDEIIGILYTKDMLKQMRENNDTLPIRDLVRPAYFVPETKKLDDLLREMRQNRTHMVMVVDEYGSIAGLVTIEDLVEEIVGDIQDEYDHEEKLYEKVSDGEYIIDAKLSIYDFNDLLAVKLDDTDYETLGGFVYAQLDKIPNMGDTITFDRMTFTVLDKRGRRITKIRVQCPSGEHEKEIDGKLKPLMLPSPEEREQRVRQNNHEQHLNHAEEVSRYKV